MKNVNEVKVKHPLRGKNELSWVAETLAQGQTAEKSGLNDGYIINNQIFLPKHELIEEVIELPGSHLGEDTCIFIQVKRTGQIFVFHENYAAA